MKPKPTTFPAAGPADRSRAGFERKPGAEPSAADGIRSGFELEHRPVHFDAGSLDTVRRQLHDGLGQILTSACFLASTLQSKLRKRGLQDGAELDEMIVLLNQAIAESQSLVAHCDRTRRSLLAGGDQAASPE